jgi:hypothetical protein
MTVTTDDLRRLGVDDQGSVSPVNTPYHHYWISANKLSKNGHLKTPNGSTVTVVGGTVPKQHDGWMWDLTVPGNNDHDFYVIPAQTDNGDAYHVVADDSPVLVHNSGPFCGTPIGGKIGDALGEADFHGQDVSLDEVVQAVNGHTGDGMPGMGRPTVTQIETTLRNAGPVQLTNANGTLQNAASFDYNGVRAMPLN